MNKNEEIEIQALMNGYQISYGYRVRIGEVQYDYTYQTDKYMFKTWDEVVEFVKEHSFTFPPVKI